MRSGIGVLLLLAASCTRDGGVIIEVTPTSGEVDSIRLFIGTGDATQNASLVVPVAKTANAVTTASVDPLTRWGRDANNNQDLVMVSANETARFVLVKTDTDTLGSIIAVGFRGTQPIEIATQFDVSLPGNTYKLYHLTLEAPAAPPVTWGPDLSVLPNEAVCIGYSDPKQQRSELSTAFIVTPGDQDCDGLVTPEDGECNPDAWKGSRPPNLDELTCLAIEPADATCHLGGPLCRDGLGKMPTECKPSSYCMPASVCERAPTLDDAKDLSRIGPVLPARYDCIVHVENGALCQDRLILPMYPNGGRNCTGATISTAGQKFDNHFDLPSGTGEIGVKLDTGTCEVSLAPSGKPPDASRVGGIVAVALDNGRGVAVPVLFAIDRNNSGCGDDVMCTRESTLGDQQLVDCATSLHPQPVAELAMPMGAKGPTLSADMLDIWFSVADKDIWHSSRTSVLKPWAAPAIVPELAGISGTNGAHTVNPHVSPDGLTMFLGSDRIGTTGGDDVFKSHRTARTDPWPPPDTIVELVSQGDEQSAAMDGAGTFLVMSKQLDAGNGFDIYTAQRSSATLPWSNPVVALAVSTLRDDLNPYLTKDGLELWFSTTTPNFGLEIYMSQRTNLTQSFPMARRILELGSTSDDSDPWVSDGGHTVYFASTRLNGISQIFLARR